MKGKWSFTFGHRSCHTENFPALCFLVGGDTAYKPKEHIAGGVAQYFDGLLWFLEMSHYYVVLNASQIKDSHIPGLSKYLRSSHHSCILSCTFDSIRG